MKKSGEEAKAGRKDLTKKIDSATEEEVNRIGEVDLNFINYNID